MIIKKKTRKYFQTIILALVIAMVTKIFILDFIQVNGDSMLNTLRNGEKLLVNKILYKIEKPIKGSIIIFDYPGDRNYQLIKRIIALEGETVEIKDGLVLVNGEEIVENYIKEKTIDDFSKRVVPNNSVFVLGDNRHNSKDSRFQDVGFIPVKLIKGKAIYVIWPMNNMRKIL